MKGKFKECGHVDHSTQGTPKGDSYGSMNVASSPPSNPSRPAQKLSDGGSGARQAKYQKV